MSILGSLCILYNMRIISRLQCPPHLNIAVRHFILFTANNLTKQQSISISTANTRILCKIDTRSIMSFIARVSAQLIHTKVIRHYILYIGCLRAMPRQHNVQSVFLTFMLRHQLLLLGLKLLDQRRIDNELNLCDRLVESIRAAAHILTRSHKLRLAASEMVIGCIFVQIPLPFQFHCFHLSCLHGFGVLLLEPIVVVFAMIVSAVVILSAVERHFAYYVALEIGRQILLFCLVSRDLGDEILSAVLLSSEFEGAVIGKFVQFGVDPFWHRFQGFVILFEVPAIFAFPDLSRFVGLGVELLSFVDAGFGEFQLGPSDFLRQGLAND
mmetsp:Transcript_51689/g.82450  ORF Transcript_51689/g.82450 Transcript_51689/m.82450 type:complete len:326 (+) Transcript_51689:112-1089(+)